MMRVQLSVLLAAFCLSFTGCADVLNLTASTTRMTADTTKMAFDKTRTLFKPSNLLSDEDALADADSEEEDTQFVGGRVTISGGSTPLIEGVGLVTGLNNTGGDVPPSSYRRTILDDMKKRRIENPQQLLQSPSTAVVIVRAFLPPLAQKGDTIDIEVRLPDGSEATSLDGGWLLPCMLYEQGFVAGRGRLRDDEAAVASGPILLSPNASDDLSKAALVRRGSIPGGARYIGENRHLSLNLRPDFRSVRNSGRMAAVIGRRFHGFDEYGLRKPLAEGKTDARIELKVPKVYADNYPRFLKVVRRVAVSESPIEQRIRIERLREDLLDPHNAEDASLKLEAIGRDSIVALREALTADALICRFHAAAALAYLGDDTGVEVLAEAASEDRALRVWAFLAMSCLDGGEAIPELVQLLDSESTETRYGAIRALTTIDPNHPAIRGEEVTDRCVLRVVDSTAKPLVHLTKSRKSEITVFGADQEFLLPLAARAGAKIIVVGNQSDRSVRLSRFSPGEPDETRVVTARVSDVLRAAAELGASYPDLVGLLMQTERQHNLAGTIAIDALPKAGRTYIGGAFGTGVSDAEQQPESSEIIDRATSSEPNTDDPAAQTASVNRVAQRDAANPEQGFDSTADQSPDNAPEDPNLRRLPIGFSAIVAEPSSMGAQDVGRSMYGSSVQTSANFESAETATSPQDRPPAQAEPALVR